MVYSRLHLDNMGTDLWSTCYTKHNCWDYPYKFGDRYSTYHTIILINAIYINFC